MRIRLPRELRAAASLNNWLVILFILGSAALARAACEVQETTYRGWKSYRLSNGLATLHVVPQIGGRVIQFELAEHPFLFVDQELAGKVFPPEENGGGKGGWKNYGGSKLWPAPQGWQTDDQWPGPPDPVLDGGVYEGQITSRDPSRVSVKVISPKDERTGIQLWREISLFEGETRVRHDCGMRNVSRRPVRWSIWEVVQLDTASAADPTQPNDDFWAYCPINPQSAHARGFVPLYGQVTHPSWQPDDSAGLFAVQYAHRVGKVGLDSDAGWLAAVNGKTDHCFVGKFQWFAGREYPDHSSVEFWLNGAGEFILNGLAITNSPNHKETPYLMEAEILSPLVALQPGDEYRFQIDWFATRCPKPIVEITEAAAIHQPLRVTVGMNRAALTGVFGVFYEGRARAVILDALGNVLAREDLGAVGPSRTLELKRELPLPKGASRISVRLTDAKGRDVGLVGAAPLQGLL